MLSAANYQALDKRPDFVNLSPQPIIQNHLRQANLGQDAALVSANYINFDLNALNIVKGNKGRFHNIKNTEMSGQEISLRLPNVEKPVLLYVDNVQNLVKGVVTYTGYRIGQVNDFFILSIADEGVMAKINYGKYIYIIKPIKSKSVKHTIAQLDKTLIIKDIRDDVAKAVNQKKLSAVTEKSNNGSGHVKVLFYFENGVWNQSLYVSLIVSEMNAALSRSGVPTSNTISSAGIKLLGASFTGLCKDGILGLMDARQGAFANIDQDLNAYGADIAVTLIKTYTGQICDPFSGPVGRVGGVAYPYNPGSPFAVFADAYALGDLTALHELGHVFGGSHAIMQPYIIRNRYAKGFTMNNSITPSDSWQTIMGSYGYSNCNFSGVYSTCERLDYFSNPNKVISYEGNNITLGDTYSKMYLWLDIGMPVVSNYKGLPIPPPPAPNPISATNESCFGLNSVTWTAQSGATEYKLYKSTSSNFTSPVMLYNGTNTTTAVNVNSGLWYLRAQACNASGCSVYSNQVTAYRISNCL